MSDAGFGEVIELADDVFSQVKLDSVQTARLSNIVGFDVRKPAPSSTPDSSSRDAQEVRSTGDER